MNVAVTLYLKMEQNPQVNHTHIVLSDVCEMWCKEKEILKQCQKITLSMEQEGKPSRKVYSSLDLIQKIQQEIRELEVVALGEEDMVVAYTPIVQQKQWVQWAKAGGIFGIVFLGSAFAIMTFNRDVSVDTLFLELYQLATGTQSSGFTILEIGYSIGLAVGILGFYNHFSQKKILGDPTPLEVEMRQYESDICNTIIADVSRKSKAEKRKQARK